jgi:glycosyltransferase involved in cell wall biosynthesis
MKNHETSPARAGSPCHQSGLHPRGSSRALLPDGMDVVCLSHLRWDSVVQRPQHLLTRFARSGRVFFFEEPVLDEASTHAWLEVRPTDAQVMVATPHVPPGLDAVHTVAAQRWAMDWLLAEHGVADFALWYCTPMALPFTRHLGASLVVYDCMDGLSALAGAPAELREREAELFHAADVVFTGGHGLYEVKRKLHPNVHAFPSSIDLDHFKRGALSWRDPDDQAAIARPRLGFNGVVDERLDRALLRGIAAARPDWQLVLVGPVKIDPATLPQAPNIHYLGSKPYADLPRYLSGWDVAVLLFARNHATRFVRPTKTPEYLAAGKPVVSTSIRDVVRPYGELGLVEIADQVGDFVAACERMIARPDRRAWLEKVDAVLAQTSWDRTHAAMVQQMLAALDEKRHAAPLRRAAGGRRTR